MLFRSQLKATGPATIGGKKICIDGDEKQVEVPGCTYVAPPYVIPGVGTLKIDSLAGDQKASHSNVAGKLMLLKGSNFTAKFEVQSPAQLPAPPGPPVPDGSPSYIGQGQFIPANQTVIGT